MFLFNETYEPKNQLVSYEKIEHIQTKENKGNDSK